MKKTYADECLERAERATKEPWIKWKGHYEIVAGKVTENTRGCLRGKYKPICEMDDLGTNKMNNTKFIAHARTDVPELARRLKKACQILRDIHPHFSFASKTMNDLADELEAPLNPKLPSE